MQEVNDGTDVERQYRLDISYLGTAFFGWQLQTAQNSVQAELEKALTVILRRPTRVVGSSRTDTGVHAEQQVACFLTGETLDHARFLKSLNALLPPSIRVYHVREVPRAFHPIRDSQSKVYRYRIWRDTVLSPFCRDLVWHQPQLSDTACLAAEMTRVIGTHDFTSFCAVDSGAKTRVRTIHAVHLRHQGPLTEIYLHGNGFLKQMVRSLVGSAVGVALGRGDKGNLAQMLAAKDRTAAGTTAPAHGLCLVRIVFDEDFCWEDFLAQQGRGLVIPC